MTRNVRYDVIWFKLIDYLRQTQYNVKWNSSLTEDQRRQYLETYDFVLDSMAKIFKKEEGGTQ